MHKRLIFSFNSHQKLKLPNTWLFETIYLLNPLQVLYFLVSKYCRKDYFGIWNRSVTTNDVHWGINKIPHPSPPPLFYHAPSSTCKPMPPFLGNPPYILVFCEPPTLKNQIFQWTPNILKFFILNSIPFFKSN